ncbi:uncharacterized protein LOC119305586 isoform X1 [Triticum dicoccoides]|uniref:uncharacterized protein LOC119305586 isoform X1 n=1 Tax=Triticum dicoccoides TaxID=85692 RepID=UPI00188EC18E|nr:uncharacterized protein LOC119305586 isoform X1 [Triticum dicoccoides]
MKIFSWMANKISGKQEASRFPASSSGPSRSKVPDCRNDEFSDWPQSLLAIGTFGNKQIEEVAQVQDASEDGQSMQDAIKFTEEEVDKIQKEFAMILASKDQTETHDPHDDDQVASHKNVDESINEKHRDQLFNKIVISKAKDSPGKKASTLKPRSVASLLKLLMRKGGFASAVPDPRNSFPQSRMEKLLKAILQKKIHPQNSSALVPRRHLDWKPDEQEINECLEDALRDLDDDGAKWVKTDSDCKLHTLIPNK